MDRRTGTPGEIAVQLWLALAAALEPVVGRNGFRQMYARSLQLTRRTFPWFAPERISHVEPTLFAELLSAPDGRSVYHVYQAQQLLLFNFYELLASLIGAALTDSIFRTAWDEQEADDSASNEATDHG
jgi:hypothetical protein